MRFSRSRRAPELNDRPRIILAAGSVDDQELTSSVLWLRRFGLDISCVELTPYRLPDGDIILVPRVIIPIAEARSYLVGIERKEAVQASNDRTKHSFLRSWSVLSQEFNQLGAKFSAPAGATGQYLQIRFGDPDVHYEWALRRRAIRLDVALHFESSDKQRNSDTAGDLKKHEATITQGIEYEFSAEPWGKRWAEVRFRLPYTGEFPEISILRHAAELMKSFIDRTWPIIEPHVKHR